MNPYRFLQSHLEWVRGLKHPRCKRVQSDSEVAPRVGAWIETWQSDYAGDHERSHLEWVRGLKLLNSIYQLISRKSHLEWVRGLKRNEKEEH